MSALAVASDPRLTAVAGRLRDRRPAAGPLVVGLTGSVASGKSTFAASLQQAVAAWPERPRVELVCTDGFLRPNAELDAAGLTNRKGFPESYDVEALRGALAAVRAGPAVFPAYSHVTYDIDPALARTVDSPDVLIVEGLSLQIDPPPVDVLIYLQAEEALLETWFADRFIGLWRAAEHDPASFYARFRNMDEAGARAFAGMVWAGINLPNLREHISRARALAQLVVTKGPGHVIAAVEERFGA
ncbi:type I pantothenate kinase [Caulobacter sp. KR2-114]|uniref:type I pantothenate kinase n=1 Tax=Caulobacter sp. KR2-114 TaxID=3400912 RepID=UPI003C097F72